MAMKKPIFAKARPKKLGNQSLLTRSLKLISQLKEKLIRNLVKRFLFIKTYLSHKLLKSLSRERKSNG